jgi:hypothetical protein
MEPRRVLIPGRLDGVMTGIRQLRRTEPLETEEIAGLRVPTLAEMARIKAWLLATLYGTRHGRAARAFATYCVLQPPWNDWTHLVSRLARAACALASGQNATRLRPWTRGERKSLALHRYIAARLKADPAAVEVVRRRLDWPRSKNPAGGSLFRYYDEWDRLLAGPIDVLIDVLVSPTGAIDGQPAADRIAEVRSTAVASSSQRADDTRVYATAFGGRAGTTLTLRLQRVDGSTFDGSITSQLLAFWRGGVRPAL